MKKILLAASIAAAFSTSAFAEGAFDGAYVGLSAGFLNNSAKVSASGSSTNYGTTGKFGGQILAGYSYGFDKTFNVATNVFYGLGSNNIDTTNKSSVNLKKVWGLSVEPGIYLADKTLAYVKLGVARANLKSGSSSANTNGFLYGVGLKHMVTSNVYVGAEFQKVDFRSRSFAGMSINPDQTYSGVTVGYKF